LNRKNRDQQNYGDILQWQIDEKERQKKEKKRREEEEELRLEEKLRRDRDDIDAKLKREVYEQDRKMNDAKMMNERAFIDATNRANEDKKSRFTHYRTPHHRSSKYDFIGNSEYDQIEDTLVRNAHNSLRNEFNISIERMRQDFDTTNTTMKYQIDVMKKFSDKEKDEKR
jgi:hypothetical protein